MVLTTAGAEKAMLLLLALCAAGAVSGRIFMFNNSKRNQDPPKQDGEEEAK